MNIRRYASLGLIAITALFIVGCFEFEERLVLKKDGSGTLEVEYWTMDDVNLDVEDYRFPDKEADIREEVENKYTSDRVKLEDFKVRYQDKSRHVRFKIAFKDFEDLNDLRQFQENEIEIKRQGKKFEFHRTVYINDGDSDLSNEPDNAFEAFVVGIVKEGLSNIKFRFEVEMPYDIVASNADWTPGERRAVWKYRLSDVISKGEVNMKLKTK